MKDDRPKIYIGTHKGAPFVPPPQEHPKHDAEIDDEMTGLQAPRYVTDAERANLGCSTPGECPCEILSRMDATIVALLNGIPRATLNAADSKIVLLDLQALAAQVRGTK